ncbi:DUF2141 domain-containing protein [Rhodovibrionaceae bacterium A322]
MPSNSQRLFGVLASAALMVGGAWLASNLAPEAAQAGLEVPPGTSLEVTLTGVRNATGNLIVLVYDDRSAFNSYDPDGAVGYREVPARFGDVTIAFAELTEGPYAIAAFHDEDGNQDLTMAGDWPVEGYATSGAKDEYDLPTFSSAAIAQGKISIPLFYVQ